MGWDHSSCYSPVQYSTSTSTRNIECPWGRNQYIVETQCFSPLFYSSRTPGQTSTVLRPYSHVASYCQRFRKGGFLRGIDTPHLVAPRLSRICQSTHSISSCWLKRQPNAPACRNHWPSSFKNFLGNTSIACLPVQPYSSITCMASAAVRVLRCPKLVVQQRFFLTPPSSLVVQSGLGAKKELILSVHCLHRLSSTRRQ